MSERSETPRRENYWSQLIENTLARAPKCEPGSLPLGAWGEIWFVRGSVVLGKWPDTDLRLRC